MAITLVTTQTIIARNAGALYNVAIGSTLMNQLVAQASVSTSSTDALLNQVYVQSVGTTPTTTVAATLITNLGITGATAIKQATDYIVAVLNANSPSFRGAAVNDLLDLFVGLTNDANFGAAATAYNAKVANAEAYALVAGNVANGDFGKIPGVVDPTIGGTFTLTPGADTAGATSAFQSGLASTFRFTSGNEKIDAGVGTLSGADVFLDATTTDADQLIVSLTGATGTFTAQNIETIKATFVSGTPIVQLDNTAGVKTVEVNGSVAGTVNGFNATTVQPVMKTNAYTNNLTITPTSLAGTALLGTAETVNVEVAGASFGTTAATQSVITINGGAGTLETLNLTSTGTAANTFALATAGGSLLGTVNVKGSVDANIRVAHADVTGITLNAAENTAITNIIVDRNAAGTASTNLTNFTGVEKFTFRDSTAGTDALVATNIAAGAAVDVVSNFATGSTFSVTGAATATADVVTLTLDHATAATGVTVVALDVQNVETLNVVSNGNSAATIAAANGNFLGNATTQELVGDFTKIVITGDTTFTANIDVDAPAAGNLVTTVDASGMTGTAAVVLSAANDGNATNRYSITGTGNNDTLAGGIGNDTILAGAGNDTINLTSGTDTLTGGAGRDTFVASVPVMGSDGTAVSTIVDFTTGTATTSDVLQIATAAVGAGGTYIGTSAGLTAAIAYSVIVLTDAAYANATAASTAINVVSTSTTAAVVVYLNSTTGFVQAYLDNDLAVDAVAGTNTDFSVFQNLTTLTGVATFDTTNFTVV